MWSKAGQVGPGLGQGRLFILAMISTRCCSMSKRQLLSCPLSSFPSLRIYPAILLASAPRRLTSPRMVMSLLSSSTPLRSLIRCNCWDRQSTSPLSWLFSCYRRMCSEWSEWALLLPMDEKETEVLRELQRRSRYPNRLVIYASNDDSSMKLNDSCQGRRQLMISRLTFWRMRSSLSRTSLLTSKNMSSLIQPITAYFKYKHCIQPPIDCHKLWGYQSGCCVER